MSNFLKSIVRLRNYADIHTLINIGNMDETPIYFNQTGEKTINRIGNKIINNNTFGQEKLTITCILKILLNGNKLPPLLILKEKKKRLQKKLNKLPLIIQKKIFITCQINVWSTINVMKYWIKTIWKSYAMKTKCAKLLIPDKTTWHIHVDIIRLLENYNTRIIFIPWV